MPSTDRIAEGETQEQSEDLAPLPCWCGEPFFEGKLGDETYPQKDNWVHWGSRDKCWFAKSGFSIESVPMWNKLQRALRSAATLAAQNEALIAQLSEERKKVEGLEKGIAGLSAKLLQIDASHPQYSSALTRLWLTMYEENLITEEQWRYPTTPKEPA